MRLGVRRARRARALAFAFATSSAASAQTLPPGVGVDSYGRYTSCHNPGGHWNNPTSAWLDGEITKGIQQNLLTNLMLGQAMLHEMVMTEMRRDAGAKRIAMGNATTTFTSSEATSSLARRLSSTSDAAGRARALAGMRDSLEGFAKVLAAHGCRGDDLADAIPLAMVMCYAAWRDEDPGPERLAKLRRATRSRWLADAVFQGRPDSERQELHEGAALAAMTAIAARAGSKNATLPEAQRRALAVTARDVGRAFLAHHLAFPVDGAELTADGFGDRGVRLAASRLGTTRFVRTENPLTVGRYAATWGFLFDGSEAPFLAMLTRFDAIVAAAGGLPDDLADARAAACAVLIGLESDGARELSKVQVQHLRTTLRTALLSDADIQRMSDEERQERFETMALDVMRLRTLHALDEAVLATPKPEDPFAAIAHVAKQGHARAGIERARAESQRLLGEWFLPRKFTECVLVEDGFAPKGTPGAIERQAPADAPVLAGFPERRGADAAQEPQAALRGATTRFVRAPGVLSPAGTIWIPALSGSSAQDSLASFDRAIASAGGDRDDLADARATAFALAWNIVQGDSALDAAQLAGVRAHFAAQMRASPELQAWKDAQRQQAYERLGLEIVPLVAEVARLTQKDDARDGLEALRRALAESQLAEARNRAKELATRLLAPKRLTDLRMGKRGPEWR